MELNPVRRSFNLVRWSLIPSDGAQDIWRMVGEDSALRIHHLGVGVVVAVVGEGGGDGGESGAGRRAFRLRLSH